MQVLALHEVLTSILNKVNKSFENNKESLKHSKKHYIIETKFLEPSLTSMMKLFLKMVKGL